MEQETLNNIYTLLKQQKETNNKLCDLFSLMLDNEQPKEDVKDSEGNAELWEFIKKHLNSYDIPDNEETIKAILTYVKKSNLDKDQIAEQIEKVYLASKKKPIKDYKDYLCKCFSNLIKGE